MDVYDSREFWIGTYKAVLETANQISVKTKLEGIGHLSKIKMSERLLKKTGVGLTIQAMTSTDDEVGEAARDLIKKWKAIVAENHERRMRLIKLADEERVKRKRQLISQAAEERKRKRQLSSSDKENEANQPKKIKGSGNVVDKAKPKKPAPLMAKIRRQCGR